MERFAPKQESIDKNNANHIEGVMDKAIQELDVAGETLRNAEEKVRNFANSNKVVVQEIIDSDLLTPEEKDEFKKRISVVVEKTRTSFQKFKRTLMAIVVSSMMTSYSCTITVTIGGSMAKYEASEQFKQEGEVAEDLMVGHEALEQLKQEKARQELLKRLRENSKENVATILNNVRKHILSVEYFRRLQKECGGNLEKAKQAQKQRIVNLDYLEVLFGNESDLAREYVIGGLGVTDEIAIKKKIRELKRKKDIPTGLAWYDNKKNREVIMLPQSNNNNDTIFHEIFHASTRGDLDIPEPTKRMLEDSFRSDDYEKSEIERYKLKKPTERLVRKQILDHELDRLGIKKYGEKFTEKHYKKMMSRYGRGGFSEGARDFIETTRPKYFIRIFNEIAENKYADNGNIDVA